MKRIKRAPEAGHSYLFTMPPVNTINIVHLINDCGGIDAVSENFGLTKELITIWFDGIQPPPKYFLIALWWQSWRGFDQGFAETHYANSRNYRELCNAEVRINYLERLLISNGVQLSSSSNENAAIDGPIPGRNLVESEKRVELLELVVYRALERLGEEGRYLKSIAFTGQ